MTINTQIIIQADLLRVFTVFTNLERMAERVQGIHKLELLHPPAQMALGTTWRETRVLFGKEATEEMRVTGLDPQARVVIEAESHGTHYTSAYTFSEVPSGVLVKLVFTSTPVTLSANILSLLSFIVAGATKKMLQKDMEDLKNYLEST